MSRLREGGWVLPVSLVVALLLGLLPLPGPLQPLRPFWLALVLAAGPLPDAIFCSNDESAFGLMTELKGAGIRIPRDIAVAGFDDLTFSQVFDPPLTTVRLPRREMAQASVLYLKRLIEGGAEVEHQIVPHELIIRESSGGRWGQS